MNKKDDDFEKDTDFQDLEKILNETDFSAGHKEVVWEKIKSKMQTPSDKNLSMDELDKVAGGMNKPPEDNGKPKKGGS